MFAVYAGSPDRPAIDAPAGTATRWGNGRLIGGAYADTSFQDDRISLSIGDNFANADGGNDRLFADTGSADNVDGQEDDASIAAGVGRQTGADGIDTPSYAGTRRTRALTIDFTSNTMFAWDPANNLMSQESSNFEHLEAVGRIDNPLGSSGADRVLGFARSDTLDGWNANKTLDGGAGSDLRYGGRQRLGPRRWQ